jgi:integrase/recombinase XerD
VYSEMARVAAFLTGNAVEPSAIPWDRLQRQELLAIREWANESFAPVIASRILQGVRAARRRREPGEEWAYSFDPSWLRGRGHAAKSNGARVTTREVRCLLAACQRDDSPSGRRDAAVLALMACGGLSATAISALAVGDYEDDLKALRVRHGRHRVTRVLVLQENSRRAIEAWLSDRGMGMGSLFFAVDRWGQVREGTGLGPTAVNQLLTRRAREAGIGLVRPREMRAQFLARLWQDGRQNPFAPVARLSRDDDGEPSIVLLTQDSNLGVRNVTPAP